MRQESPHIRGPHIQQLRTFFACHNFIKLSAPPIDLSCHRVPDRKGGQSGRPSEHLEQDPHNLKYGPESTCGLPSINECPQTFSCYCGHGAIVAQSTLGLQNVSYAYFKSFMIFWRNIRISVRKHLFLTVYYRFSSRPASHFRFRGRSFSQCTPPFTDDTDKALQDVVTLFMLNSCLYNIVFGSLDCRRSYLKFTLIITLYLKTQELTHWTAAA